MAQVAVVFGGTSGIGLAIAQRLLRNKYKTVVLSRSKEKVERAENELSQEFDKGNVLGLQCDVRDEKQLQASFKTVESFGGHLDVLVNSAGVNKDELLIKASEEHMRFMLDTNLLGPMLTTKTAIKYMLPKRKGCIINIGSVVGMKGNIGQTAYSASKAGLIGVTKSLARELGSKGIRVNLIVPGLVTTDMTAKAPGTDRLEKLTLLKRFGTPQEVANVANMLITSTYVTGAVIYVDGGLNLQI